MLAREEIMLEEATSHHLIKAQLEDLQDTCNKYLSTYTTNYLVGFGHSEGGQELQNAIYDSQNLNISRDHQRAFFSQIGNLSLDPDPAGSNPEHCLYVFVRDVKITGKLRIHMQKLGFLDNVLLNKLREVSLIHDKFVLLERSFGYDNFISVLADCEKWLADPVLLTTMSAPHNDHLPHNQNREPETTAGAQLIAKLTTKLRDLREAYLDLYIPTTELAARQQYVRKLKIQAAALDNIFKKGDQSYSYIAKQVVLNEIKAVLDPINTDGDITNDTIEKIQALHIDPSNRTVMLSHTLGFFANALGLRPSDAYMSYFYRQTQILHARLENINKRDNLISHRPM